MAGALTGEKKSSDLSAVRRWLVIILVSMGSSTIYAPAYIKYAFPDPQKDALGMTLTQTGGLLGAYALTAMICYLPSGLIADRMRMKHLSTIGFIATALLTFWYAFVAGSANPSYSLLIVINILMGISSIFLWWGVRYKLVRLCSGENEYSRSIGISYGFYGAAGLIFGLISTRIFDAVIDPKTAFQTVMFMYGGALLAMGVASYFAIPKFDGEISKSSTAKAVIVDALKSLANPVVLIVAVSVFFVYFYYTCTSYTATYMKALGADPNITNVVSVIRQYGVTLLAGPVFGLLARKAKKPTLVIWIGSLVAAAGFAAAALLPASVGSVTMLAFLAVAMGFIANGIFGIVSAQLTEGKVPLAMFGAATGVVSLIGFMPDTFSGQLIGSILDPVDGLAPDVQGPAYAKVFWILAAVAVLAAAMSVILARYVKANEARLTAAEDASRLEAATA